MLRCTACGLEIAPFALQRPTEERECRQCGARLVFTKAARLEVVVDGPLLPPVPKGISVERLTGPRSYRDNAASDILVIRWRPAPDPHATAGLGALVGLNIIAVLGAVFLGPAIWLAATTLLFVTILAILGSFLARGELRVEGGKVRSSRRGPAKELLVAKDAIADLRIVQVGHESSPATEIWMRSADGTERAIARGLSSGRAALYITALLREELRLSG